MHPGERRAFARGVGWAALQNWTLRAASFVTFVVLGRILAPDQIGQAGLALAASGLVTAVVDVGVSVYVVRAGELSEGRASTAFWLSLAQALAGALLLLAASVPLAHVVGYPEVAPYLAALSLSVVFFGFSSVPAALLVRRLRFRTLAVREIVAGLSSSVIGVALALAGAGVWALVGQSLAQGAVALVLLWSLSGWRPQLVFDRADAKEILRFGAPLLGTNVVQALRDRTEQLLLGSVAGVAALGYWTIATRILGVLSEVTLATLNLVSLPLFSRARGHEGGLTRVFARTSSWSTAVLAPALALLAVTTPRLLPGVFGSQWETSVVPAQLLCAAYAVGSVTYFSRTALLASGRSGTDFALTLGGFVLHLVVVLVAAPHGLATLAVAVVAETFVVGTVAAVALRSRVGIPAISLLGAARVLLATTVATGVMSVTWFVVNPLPLLIAVAATAVVGAAAQLAAMCLLARSVLTSLWGEVVSLRASRPGP